MTQSPGNKKFGVFTRRQSTVFPGLSLFLIAVVLTFAWWNTEPRLGIKLSPNNEHWVVDWVQPGGLAWDYGVRPGQNVLETDGTLPYLNMDFDAINVLKTSEPGTTNVIISRRVETPSFNQWLNIALVLIGLSFAGTGLLVYLRASSRQVAEVFFWLCLSASIALIVAPVTAKGISWALGIEFVSTRFVANLFPIFFYVFPPRQNSKDGNLSIPFLLLLSPTLLLSFLYPIMTLIQLNYYVWLQSAGHFLLVVGLLSGLLFLFRSYFAAQSSVTKEQIRIVVLGTTITAVPLAAFSLLPRAFTGEYIIRPELSVLSVIALPLSFAYAIMRHQLMGIRRLIHRGMVYFLLSVMLVSIYLLFLSAGRALLSGISEDWIDSAISLVGVLVIGLFHSHFERAVRKVVDRLLYKDIYDYKETLYELNSRLATTHDEKDLAKQVLFSITRSMNLTFAALLAHVGDRKLAIESEGMPLPDAISAMIQETINVKLQEAYPFDEEVGLAEDGLSVFLIPLMSGYSCRGCLAIGPKQTDEPFRDEDRFLLRTFAGHIATYIEKLQLIEELREQLKELEESRLLLSKQQEEVLEWNRRLLLAQEHERSRIAQYLHDEPLQKVLFLVREVREAVEENRRLRAQALAREVATDLRDFSTRLHPSMIDDLGLVPTLQWLVSEARQRQSSMVTMETHGVEEDDRFEPEIELTIYRVAQEAINNSLKHAEASKIHLSLRRNNGSLCLAIADDGKGFNANTNIASIRRGHLGLVGMQERIRQVGGSFRVASTPGEGTTVEAEVTSRNSSNPGGASENN